MGKFVQRQLVSDQSKKFFVALPPKKVIYLRRLLASACNRFEQQCIYLSVAGHVEFIEA